MTRNHPIMALVGVDITQSRVNLYLNKSLRQLSNCRLANQRIQAYHYVIAMSVIHPMLLLLALLIVLRIRSKYVYLIKTRSGSKRNDMETAGVSLVMETTVLVSVFAEDGEMYLLVVIRQHLLMSGDVELNPGPLGVLDLRSVSYELGSIMAKWFSVGVQLGISEAKLREIEENYRTANRRFCEVISFWLRKNTQVAVTWKSLVEVLESPSVNEKGLARRLREKGGLLEVNEIPAAASSSSQLTVSTGSIKTGLTSALGKAQESECKDGVTETEETNGRDRGKKRSTEEKLDEDVDEIHGGPEAKKAKLATDTGSSTAEKPGGGPLRVIGKPRLTFPILDQIEEIPTDEKERRKQILYSESVEMMHKFQHLFSATITSLKERKVAIKELTNHIKCLGAVEPVYKDSKLGCLRCELPKAETVDDVMSIVGEYSSFFNYQMLENIINHLGGEQDRKNLEQYLQDFSEYAKRKVFECPREIGTLNEHGFTNMFVTLDKSYDNCTISSLDCFKRELRRILNVSSDVVIKLCRIAPGSLQLIFQIPFFVHKAIFPLSIEQKEALTKLGVVQLSCGDYWFTNEAAEDTQSGGDHSSDEGDSDTERQSVAPATDLLSVAGGFVSVKKQGSSVADSALGTYTRHSSVTGATFERVSQFSEDELSRDLRDEPYLRMELDAAKLQPPDDSSELELNRASWRGELDEVKRLVEEKKLNPLQVNQNGDNALHYAAAYGQIGIMKYFIEELGLNPTCPAGWKSRTPLHYAAHYKQFELIQYLVGEQQVDPLRRDEDGCTPLHKACQGGDIDVIQYLINEMKRYTSLEDVVYDRTKNGSTAAHCAALEGHLSVIKLFITEMNFDPNTPGFNNRPLLMDAAQEGHLDIVRYLIEDLQCDPSYVLGGDGTTPLHMAAAFGHLNIIQYLTQQRKQHFLIRDAHGNTPLYEAAGCGHYEAVKFFISELNCDPNTPGWRGRTPLHFAAQEGHSHIVQYLIEVIKCSPSSFDNRKTTPLHLAAGKGHLNVVKYLTKEKHCNPLCYDKVHGTPLHWAAKDGRLEVAKLFIEVLNCPPNIRNSNNKTPLELAYDQGHTNVVQYLMSFV